MIENWCNVDGELVPEERAVIPVLDRGFLFGDSVYEVIRTRLGQPFTWREHLDRLRVSAAGIGLDLGLDDREIMARVVATIGRARRGGEADGEVYVRIVVTRGTGSAPNIDLAYAPGPARVVVIARPLPDVGGKPARLALVQRLRTDPRALDPAIKSGNYLNNVLGLAEAKRAGATDCLFMNAEGHVTEASTANVYVVIDREIVTPPLDAGILAGVTRRLLAVFAAEQGIGFVERDLSHADLERADEMFLTSTTRDLAPVTHLEGRALHDGGGPGPFTAELMAGFGAFCDRRVREHDAPALAALLGG